MNFLYTDPDPVTDVIGEAQTRYLQLLFALSDRHVGVIVATFASMIFYAFQVFESEWRHLADDIEHGTIRRDLDIDPDIRNRLQEHLSPDPERAREIRRACSEGFRGVARRLWPSLHVVYCVCSGSQTVYYKHMRDTECEGLNFFSLAYVSSEGLVGVNIYPDIKDPGRYVLLPSSMFYEFIRIQDASLDQPPTLFAEQV